MTFDHLTFVNEKVTEAYGFTYEDLVGDVKEDDYGYEWKKGRDQWFKEAFAFMQGGLGGHSKLYHMVNMIKLDLPEFVFAAEGYINSECLRVLDAECRYKDLGVAGCASSGKTYPIAAFRLEKWKASPHNTLSFVCTTSLAASEQRIWGAIVGLYQSSKYKIGTYIPHKHAIVWGNFSESASDRDFTSGIIALPIEQGQEGKKAIATTRGRKQTHVSVTFDELPEMEHYVTDALVNLESNDNLEADYIGNPAKETDPHGNMLRPDDPLGYRSITQNTRDWKTRTGHAIFLNGMWSANFQIPPDKAPVFKGLMDRFKLDRMLKRCHGNKNSLEFWRNAIGFWPTSSVGNTVLTKELIVKYKADERIRWLDANRIKIVGFDTGFTFGGDSCVIQLFELGISADDRRKVLQWEEEIVIYPERNKVFEDSIAEQFVQAMLTNGVQPENVGMDISQDGGKIYRAIVRAWLPFNPRAADIEAISSMGRPTERIFSSVDPRPCTEVFDRMVTEYWMMVREGVMCQVIKGIPLTVNTENNASHDIVEQFCTREYSIRGKKFCLETKDDMKLRTQGKSPDNADSFGYGVEMARKKGLMFTSPPEEKVVKERRTTFKTVKREFAYADSGWGED